MTLRVALAPEVISAVVHDKPGAGEERIRRIEDAVNEEGAVVVPPEEADALMWLEVGDATPLVSLLDANPTIEWVQLSWAGVETLLGTGLFDRDVLFTCAKGTYGRETAEQALALILGSLRHHVAEARTRSWHWHDQTSLFGKRVTILGGGDTAANLVRLLQPFECDVTVVRRSVAPTLADIDTLLPRTDVLVLALALTDETRGVIGAHELDLLPPSSVVVNVARGAHIDTEALVTALRNGKFAAAGLDVTDPEPLPDGHPLWDLDNVLIASHSANSVDFSTEVLTERIRLNVRNYINGEALLGVVNPRAGY